MQFKKQQGAAAIEFAILFPIFFLIFYAIITYGLIFAAQQTLTLAAAEGARAAVRYPSVPTGGTMTKSAQLQARLTAACATAALATDWLSKIGAGFGSTGCSAGVSDAAGCTPPLVYVARGLRRSLLQRCQPGELRDHAGELQLRLCTADPKLLGPLLSLPTPNLLRGRRSHKLA
jgi:hypothetical protein